jgi:membrane associated rhomboid family serine protease
MAAATDRIRSSREGFYEGALVVGLLVGVMWIVEIVNSLDSQQLDSDGIISRRLAGLPGILSAPFLHESFTHLIGNTIPFVILGLVIALGGAGRVIAVTVIAVVTSGVAAWALSSAGTDTIGASGVVFGYATYLIARGLFTRSMLQIVVGVLVAVLFGASLLLSIVPEHGISWQDHVGGAAGGVLAAWLLSGRRTAAPENK